MCESHWPNFGKKLLVRGTNTHIHNYRTQLIEMHICIPSRCFQTCDTGVGFFFVFFSFFFFLSTVVLPTVVMQQCANKCPASHLVRVNVCLMFSIRVSVLCVSQVAVCSAPDQNFFPFHPTPRSVHSLSHHSLSLWHLNLAVYPF